MAKPYPERGQNYGPSDSGGPGSGTQPYMGLDRFWFAGFDAGVHPLLDALPSAIYVTDEKGHLTYFNPACIAFSGRTPELGTDSWCVTWKLFHPDGTPMPHETCPMAMALKEGRSIRGTEAIAERPDGSRIWFEPYPTPLFDGEGNLIGGINMLVDITERKRTETELRRAHDQQQAELADSTLLRNVSAAMIEQENVEAIYEQILEAAADIMRSDFASMQMFYPERGDVGELLLLASRGFAPETASFWKWVRPDSNSSCGEAFRTGSRLCGPEHRELRVHGRDGRPGRLPEGRHPCGPVNSFDLAKRQTAGHDIHTLEAAAPAVRTQSPFAGYSGPSGG